MSYVRYAYESGTRRLTGVSLRLEENIANAVADVTYTYDDAGNPTSIIDAPTAGAGDAQCFAYDGLRRLTGAWTPADGDCAGAPSTAGLGGAAPYWFTDTFDVVGNRTERVTHEAAGDTTATYAYPAAGAPGAHTLSGVTVVGPDATVANAYEYDQAGNTTIRAVGEDPVQTLTWDAEGELASVAEAGGATDSYLYTADGDRLIRRQDDATTVYLPGGQELTLAAGQVTATRYYTFGGTTIAVRTGTGAAGVTSLLSDTHGTAQVAVHNTTRATTRKYTDPYGNPRGTMPTTWAGDHGFLDKPTDTTDLTQIGARYYDPVIGRFITVDPVMDLTDPQQWHGYAYANNNPVAYSDPTGLRPLVDGGGQGVRYAQGSSSRRAEVQSVVPQACRPPVRSSTAAGRQSGWDRFWNDAGAVTSDVGRWAYDNRGMIATVAAVGGCLVPGVGQGGCAAFQAWAFAMRAQQVLSVGGGLNEQTAAVIGVDAALTGTGLGLLRTATAGATMTGTLTRAEIASATGVTATNTAGLEARANAVHGALDPIAQNSRTTAALGTAEGRTVLAGGGRDLSPAQRALVQEGEIVSRAPGAHAEVTAVNGARSAGLTPQGIGVSRPICPACQGFLEESGATITSSTAAWWFGR